MKRPIFPVIMVWWDDAATRDPWEARSETPIKEILTPVVSIGYLIEETKQGIRLAGCIAVDNGEEDPDPNVCRVVMIPAGMIRRRKVILSGELPPIKKGNRA